MGYIAVLLFIPPPLPPPPIIVIIIIEDWEGIPKILIYCPRLDTLDPGDCGQDKICLMSLNFSGGADITNTNREMM